MGAVITIACHTTVAAALAARLRRPGREGPQWTALVLACTGVLVVLSLVTAVWGGLLLSAMVEAGGNMAGIEPGRDDVGLVESTAVVLGGGPWLGTAILGAVATLTAHGATRPRQP